MQKRIIILIAALVAVFSVSLTAMARAIVMDLHGGDSLQVNCDGNRLSLTRLSRTRANAVCRGSSSVPTDTPVPTPTNTPVPTPTDTPPDGDLAGKACPDWVHDKYVAEGPDGVMYRTWHPIIDPDTGCLFGHEHGSDPRKFPAYTAEMGPFFDYTASAHGKSEPHVGFKVFVIDDHDRNLWWLVTLHQGTAGAKRAFVQFHSLDMIVAQASDNKILANVHLMADTGSSASKCGQPIPDSGPGGAGKFIPTNDCNDFYESWGASLKIGSLFKFNGAFDVDNGISTLKRNADGTYSSEEVIYTATLFDPPCDPFTTVRNSIACTRFGDARSVNNPLLTLNNTSGNSEVWTDPMGNLTSTGQGIKQYLDTTVRLSQSFPPDGLKFAGGVDGGDKEIYRSTQYCAINGCNSVPLGDDHGTNLITIPN